MKLKLLRGLVVAAVLAAASGAGPAMLAYNDRDFRIDPTATCTLALGYMICKFYDPKTLTLCYVLGTMGNTPGSISCRQYP